MISSFELAFKIVVGEEGGYSNDPRDAGGETKFGICKRDHPSLDIRNLTLEQAHDIYFREYWSPGHCSQLPPALAVMVFDSAINQGVVTAVKLLQHALGVEQDGVVGPRTLTAVAERDLLRLCSLFMAHRAIRYMSTKGFDNPDTPQPADGPYAHNWLSRTYRVMAEAIYKSQYIT